MEGITILEEQILYRPSLFVLYLCIIGVISFTIGMILFLDFNNEKIGGILLLFGVANLIFGICLSSFLHGAPNNKAIYTIRVEEKIDLNEFLNNYEIVEHEKYSNIYKIKGDIIDDNP